MILLSFLHKLCQRNYISLAQLNIQSIFNVKKLPAYICFNKQPYVRACVLIIMYYYLIQLCDIGCVEVAGCKSVLKNILNMCFLKIIL